jgi:hypothetical protein
MPISCSASFKIRALAWIKDRLVIDVLGVGLQDVLPDAALSLVVGFPSCEDTEMKGNVRGKDIDARQTFHVRPCHMTYFWYVGVLGMREHHSVTTSARG